MSETPCYIIRKDGKATQQVPRWLMDEWSWLGARIEQLNDLLAGAMDTEIQRDTFREALESIRDSFSQMNDNTHSNTAYAIATQALDPEGCAEMAKLPWPPDEQILADLKAIDQSN